MLCDVMSSHLVQYYSVLRSTVLQSTTRYYSNLLPRSTRYYSVLERNTQVLQRTTPVLLRTQKYYSVLRHAQLHTTKYCFSVLRSITPILQSIILQQAFFSLIEQAWVLVLPSTAPTTIFFWAHAVRARGSDGHQNVLSLIGYSLMLENRREQKARCLQDNTNTKHNNPKPNQKTKTTQEDTQETTWNTTLSESPQAAQYCFAMS